MRAARRSRDRGLEQAICATNLRRLDERLTKLRSRASRLRQHGKDRRTQTHGIRSSRAPGRTPNGSQKRSAVMVFGL
jgi:hypothetical protein